MKIFSTFVLTVLCFFIFGCSSTKVEQKPPIQCSFTQLEARAGVNAGVAESVSEMLSSALQNTGRFTVVDRKQINTIMQEQGFQSTQENTDQIKTGQILAVKKIFSGSFGMIGENYILSLKMIDVETSKVDFSKTWNYDDDLEDINDEFLPKVVKEIIKIIDSKK